MQRTKHVPPEMSHLHSSSFCFQHQTHLQILNSNPCSPLSLLSGPHTAFLPPNTGGQLSEDRLASEIGIFFLAGFETTGHSGAWLLYLVSQHPGVEAKICQELDEQGLLVTSARPNPRKVTYDDLSKLNYLDMAIKVSWLPL